MKGETVQLIVAPREIIPSPPYIKDASFNRGTHGVVYRNWIVGYLAGCRHFEAAPPHRFRLSSGLKWHP